MANKKILNTILKTLLWGGPTAGAAGYVGRETYDTIKTFHRAFPDGLNELANDINEAQTQKIIKDFNAAIDEQAKKKKSDSRLEWFHKYDPPNRITHRPKPIITYPDDGTLPHVEPDSPTVWEQPTIMENPIAQGGAGAIIGALTGVNGSRGELISSILGGGAGGVGGGKLGQYIGDKFDLKGSRLSDLVRSGTPLLTSLLGAALARKAIRMFRSDEDE